MSNALPWTLPVDALAPTALPADARAMQGEPHDNAHDLDSEVIVRTSNTIRARLIAELLATHDIPCSTPGLEHLSMLPLGAVIEVAISVPQKFVSEAKELIAEMESEVDPEPEDVLSAPYRESAKKPASQLSPRLKRVASIAAFIFPGGAHFYVQKSMAGLTVIAGYIAAIGLAAMNVPYGIFLGLAALAADIAGACYHCDVSREGKASGAWRSFAPTAALALTCAWGPLALGPLLPTLAGDDVRVTCDFIDRCTEHDEHNCLLRRTNLRLDGVVPDPDCAACLREHEGECASTYHSCQVACFTRAGTAP